MARRRGGKKIDFTHWTPASGEFLAFSAGAVGRLMLAAQHEPETILRTRGNLLAYIDGTQTPGALTLVAVGMVLVPEGTGTTVLWSPLVDGDAPFFWYETFYIGYEEGVTDVIDVPALSSFSAVVDSKAMRINRQHEVQMVAEQITVGSALSINIVLTTRILSGT